MCCTWRLEHVRHHSDTDPACKDPVEQNSSARSKAGDRQTGIRPPGRYIYRERMDLDDNRPRSLHSCNLHQKHKTERDILGFRERSNHWTAT